jgi:hypothetical protein
MRFGWDMSASAIMLTSSKYEADRAHELELERITGQYEIAFIQATVILNGAAATAFVSFLASNVVKFSPTLVSMAHASFIAWIAGLTAGLVAGLICYTAQKHYAVVLRSNRHVLGLTLRGQAEITALGLMPDATPEFFTKRSSEYQKRGNRFWNIGTVLGLVSIICFVAGVGLASYSVVNGLSGKSSDGAWAPSGKD